VDEVRDAHISKLIELEEQRHNGGRPVKVRDDLSQRLWRQGARRDWENEGDADRGWAEAQKQQDEVQEWIELCKGYKDYIDNIADMLAYLELHISRYPVSQLTTEQKEMLADLVDYGAKRTWMADKSIDHDDTDERPRTMNRWWR
jgi:hypothetical protein